MEETKKTKWIDGLKSIVAKVYILYYVWTNIKNGYGGWFLACVLMIISIVCIKAKENRSGSIMIIGLFSVYYMLKKLDIYYIDESIITNSIILLGFVGIMIDWKPNYKFLKIICLLLVIPVVICMNDYIKKDKLIKDPYLEKAIVRQLDISKKKLNVNELEKVIELSIVKDKVRKLEGIEGLKNLKKLEISCDYIKEYSKLRTLTSLETLWIYDVKEKDLSFLKELKNLEELHISFADENTENVVIPNGLKRLKITKGNKLNISFIGNIATLEELDLSERQINDFRPLLKLKHLKKLNISHTNIENLNIIRELYTLEELDLSKNMMSETKNGIKDLNSIAKLSNLKKLDLSYNLDIGYIDAIGSLVNLEELNLSQCRIKDLKPLENLKKLKVLNIDDNRYYNETTKELLYPQNVKVLNTLTNLKELHVNGLKLKDLAFIKDLKELENLYADKNEIGNIEGIQTLTSLKVLYLEENQIEDISPLKNLTNLRTLYLSVNKIVNIEPLRNLRKLDTLGLYENNIKDYSPLKPLGEIYERYID